MELINIFISILIVLFVSLILKIELKNILVIVIISTIVLFILAIKENKLEDSNLYTINKHIRNLNKHILNRNNLAENNNLANNLAENNLAENNLANNLAENNLANNLAENNLANNLAENNLANNLAENNLAEKNCKLMTSMDNIIDPCMYNLDDCTTDMTCIQKPNKYNLFPVTKSKKVDGIVVENFISSSNPFQMNDLSVPFNSSIIDPFEHYEMIKNEKLGDEVCSEALGNDLCFHCRKGHCVGGVCRNVSESKPGKIFDTKKKNIFINAHPYSENQPVIRVSNPDYSI